MGNPCPGPWEDLESKPLIGYSTLLSGDFQDPFRGIYSLNLLRVQVGLAERMVALKVSNPARFCREGLWGRGMEI